MRKNMSDMQNSINRLLDESAIRSVTARFADAATRGDYDAFRAVWADDAEWTIGSPPKVHAVGGDDILATYRQLRSGKDFFVQFAVQGDIVINGDEATSSCLCHEAARGPGESYYRNHCVAVDRLRRSGDGWVFTSRTFQYLWLDTSPFTGSAFALPPAGAAE
jgi:ketosteroid isomerase-like protein